MATLELGVLVSGAGTNLQAMLDATSAGSLDARVRVVVSNKPSVVALERAKRSGVPTRVIPHDDYPSREAFEDALLLALREAGVEWIVLAGFMRVLTPKFVKGYQGRIINIHPALLPSFPGTHAQRQALLYGAKVAGCTVHLVDEGVDTGPIIAQRAVPVLEDDDEASLAARILRKEHELLVEVLGLIAADRMVVVPRDAGQRPRVIIKSP
ncbi:MAG: phosphoribosylglycinamide formyltransferase [Verrucomicrobia bacterium]|nr:phosphoribosylglycinamide formyltransferase [Verrucomicrobiota bacterium]